MQMKKKNLVRIKEQEQVKNKDKILARSQEIFSRYIMNCFAINSR